MKIVARPTAPQTESGRTQEAFAAVLPECVSCGILLIDPEGVTHALNPEALRILRIESGHLRALPQSLRQMVHEAAQTGRSVRRKVLLHEETSEPAVVGLTAVPCPGGSTSVIVAINQFAPGGPLEPDLQRLDRLASIGTLSAGMAHEIKNALVAVKTFIDLLLERNPDAELAGMVRREMSRIDSITGRLLKYARPSAAVSSGASLHQTLDYALRLVHPQLSSRGIILERTFQADRNRVCGDETELEQAFVNLFLNAIEAMGPGGTLSVATQNPPTCPGQSDPGVIRVSIRDTGPGIPAEVRGRLFEPFFTTKANGTGLGLAVARRIFCEQQGAITLEDDPAKGAVFCVNLPVLANESGGSTSTGF